MTPIRICAVGLTAGLFILGGTPGKAAYETSRLGLFASPKFQRADGFSHSQVLGLTQSGWAWGYSTIYDGLPGERGTACWVANPFTRHTRRLAFPSPLDPLFTTTIEDSWIASINESGIAAGHTGHQFNTGFGDRWQSAWIVRLPDGLPQRIGLFDQAFTHAAGYQSSSIHSGPSPDGYCAGTSVRFTPHFPEYPLSTWIANADGLTTRIGMPETPEFTRNDGYAHSSYTPDWEFMVSPLWTITGGIQMTSTGLIRGHSRRFLDQPDHRGTAAWVASAVTGVTARVGLFGSGEFRSHLNTEESYVQFLTENGLCAGTSTRFVEMIPGGHAAWIGHFDGTTSSTRRVGFYDTDEFRGRDGTRHSGVLHVSPSGWAAGLSLRYQRDPFGFLASAGSAAWSADAFTGETTRIGRLSIPEFPNLDASQTAGLSMAFEVGVVAGHTGLADQGQIIGTAAWVANVHTGVTTRIGLFSSPEFTGARGAASSILGTDGQSWELPNHTPHPVIAGSSKRYPDSPINLGEAAWVADGITGQTFRVGLYEGPEFMDAQGYQHSVVRASRASNHASGSSVMAGAASGIAVWVVELGGPTRRVGLYGSPEFVNANGGQHSSITIRSESGYSAGGSFRYVDGAERGNVAWVADLSGKTVRLGHTDSAHTAIDGTLSSSVLWLKESGFATGYSNRHNGRTALSWDAATAWLYDPASERRTDFLLSVRQADGYAKSTVHYLAENGVVLGSYAAFDGNADLGERAFVHVPEFGTFDLGLAESASLASVGLAALASAHWLLHDDWLLGYGVPLPGGGQGVFATKLNLAPNLNIHSRGGDHGQGASFDLVWPATAGSSFSVESSHDLTTWHALPESFRASSDEMRVKVDSPAETKALYWRVRRTP